MKLSVFVLAASFLVATNGRPGDKPMWQLHPLPKKITYTGAFGGTFNFAKKQEGNIHAGTMDHSKYEVYEPQEHMYGGKDVEGHEGHGKGNQYYGHYGARAQKEYSKGSHEHDDGGYEKESGDSDHVGLGSHGILGHDGSEGKYGYQTSAEKEGHRGVGYYVTEGHHEYRPKVTSNAGQHNNPYDYAREGESKEVIGVSKGLGDFVPVQHLSTNSDSGGYNFQQQNHDEHKSVGKYDNFGPKRETGGLGSYSSGKHEDHKYQESSTIGEYETHESQHSDGYKVPDEHVIRSEKREGRGFGEHATGKHENVKHGDKPASNMGEYGTSDQDHGYHKGAHSDEGSSEKETNGGLGDYASGTYDVRKYEGREQVGKYATSS